MALASCGGSNDKSTEDTTAAVDTTVNPSDDTVTDGSPGTDPAPGRLSPQGTPPDTATAGPGGGDETGVDNGDKQ